MTKTPAILVHSVGGPEVLEPGEIELVAPERGEIRLRHSAIGVDFIDVYHRTGLYPPGAYPYVPGMQGAGVVESLGAGVTSVRAGDHVAYASLPLGAYAERRNMPAERVVKLPANVSDEIAAATMLKGMTTRYLVNGAFHLQRDQVAVVHAAAGGVGSLLVQWAKHLGAHVIGVVGSEAKAAFARELGCDAVAIGVSTLAPLVQSASRGRGADVVYDSVGKDTFAVSLDVLAVRGTLVMFGQSSGVVPPFDLALLSRKSLFLTRPSLGHYTATRADLEASAHDLFEMIGAGRLRVTIGARYPLREAAHAHRDLESRRTSGALVLVTAA